MLQYNGDVIIHGEYNPVKVFLKEVKNLSDMVNKYSDNLDKNTSSNEFQEAFNKMKEDKFNIRVQALKESGMSEHEALTQAGLENTDRIEADYMDLSLNEKVMLYDFRQILEQKFSKDVANKLASILINELKEVPYEALADKSAINKVIKEALSNSGKEYSKNNKIDSRVDELMAQGMSKHTALMMAGQEIL